MAPPDTEQISTSPVVPSGNACQQNQPSVVLSQIDTIPASQTVSLHVSPDPYQQTCPQPSLDPDTLSVPAVLNSLFGAVDEGSGIMEELDSGQTKITEVGDDEGSGIKKELHSGQTKIMETGGVSPEEIPRSKPEIFRFVPITSEKLKDLFRTFKVEYPEDPDPNNESFVRQIIQEDMLRKLETAVESLSKGIVLTKNIPTKRHHLPNIEACVLEEDVVYEGDQFRATRKV